MSDLEELCSIAHEDVEYLGSDIYIESAGENLVITKRFSLHDSPDEIIVLPPAERSAMEKWLKENPYHE